MSATTFGRAEVDGDAVLALHRLHPAQLGEREDHADAVAGERLDLDDAGTEIGEHRRAVRCGEQGRELEDRDTGQRQVRRRRGWCDRRCGLGRGQRKHVVAVGVQLRRAPREVGGSAGGLHDRSRLTHRAVLDVVEIDREPVVDELRMFERLRPVAELLGEHVRIGVEDRAPVGERLVMGRLEHLRPERHPLVGVVTEHGHALPLGIGEHPVEPEGLHLRSEQVRSDGHELQPASVLGETDEEHERERAGGPPLAVVGVGLAERVGPAGHDQVLEPRPGVEGGERLHQVGLDPLTDAAALAFDQRGERAVDRHLAGGERGERHVHERRSGVRAHATEGLEHTELRHHRALVAGHVAVRALPAPPRHRGVHEARVERAHRVVAETDRVEHAGLVRLDQHVGMTRQVAQDLAVALVVDVEHDAALATTPERVGGVLADLGTTRRLDLDHVGTEVGEQLTDLCTHTVRRQVDDSQACEWSHDDSPSLVGLRLRHGVRRRHPPCRRSGGR